MKTFEDLKPKRINQFITEIDKLIDEYHAELYLKDDVFKYIELLKQAALSNDEE